MRRRCFSGNRNQVDKSAQEMLKSSHLSRGDAHEKPQLILTLLLAMPAAIMAQHPNSPMTHDMNMSAAAKENMAAMQKMHSDMMNAMKESDADKMFARSMLEHHKGAIAMAETELKYGKDPEMKKMAQDIIKAQKAEIEHLETWLKK